MFLDDSGQPLLDVIHHTDLLTLCGALPDKSVALIPFTCYNSSSIQHVKGIIMDEKEICRLYTEERFTLRQIADVMNSNHHTIRRILVKHGISITQEGRKRKPFTDEHRRKISESSKGRTSWSRGKKLSEEFRRANMKGRLYTQIDLSKYPDYDRLFFLTSILSKRKEHIGYDDATREPFLDKFYFDAQFNAIYDAWIVSGKNKWYRPTLDHMTAQANGGSWELDNLQFLTWFENRAKADMNEDEWQAFLIHTNTHSDLFIRVK